MAAKLPPEVLAYFIRMGRLGGTKGGRVRAERMTPQQRSEAARLAVQARWAKHKAHEALGKNAKLRKD